MPPVAGYPAIQFSRNDWPLVDFPGPDNYLHLRKAPKRRFPIHPNPQKKPSSQHRQIRSKEDNSASSITDDYAVAADKSEAVRSQADREKVVSPLTKAETTFRDERPGPSAEDGAAKNTRNLSPAEEVRALWAEVGQGNTTAEVTLAKLYLIGGGVTKNCDQARVLLRAAAKKGNSEAIT